MTAAPAARFGLRFSRLGRSIQLIVVGGIFRTQFRDMVTGRRWWGELPVGVSWELFPDESGFDFSEKSAKDLLRNLSGLPGSQ